MLIYALLYLTGYERPTLDDIKHFRQLGSPDRRPPGEFRACRGSRSRPARWGRAWRWPSAWRSPSATSTPSTATIWSIIAPSSSPATADLMEGINHEAVGLAGNLKLGRLIVLWDDNNITIDGSTDLSRNEDVVARHQAAQWHTVRMRRARCRRRQPRHRRSARRPAAEPDPLPDDHRLRRAQQAGHCGDPRLGARQGRSRGGAQASSGSRTRTFTVPDDVLDRLARRPASAARSSMRCGRSGWSRAAARTNSCARLSGKVSDAWLQALSRQAARRPEAGRDPQGVGNGAGGDQRRHSRRRSAARPTSPARTTRRPRRSSR